jgi:hypothetical protein
MTGLGWVQKSLKIDGVPRRRGVNPNQKATDETNVVGLQPSQGNSSRGTPKFPNAHEFK